MRRTIRATALLVSAVLASAGMAHASGGWHYVKGSSAGGRFAIGATSATIWHPKALAVRLIGHVRSGEGVATCSKGYRIISNSRSFSRAGFYTLPMTRGARSCDVTASVGGSGKVTVQILKQ